MKIKLFKKENNFKKKDFELNPNLYWKIVLVGAFIIMIFSFFFGYYLFTQINSDTVLPGTGSQIPLINKNRLSKALNYFSEREQKSTEIINSSPPVVDPSR